MSTGLIFALICALAALVYGIVSVSWIMKKSTGNDRMREIAAAIQAGAQAYLNRQYTTIAIVGVLLFVIIWWALGGATAGGCKPQPRGRHERRNARRCGPARRRFAAPCA